MVRRALGKLRYTGIRYALACGLIVMVVASMALAADDPTSNQKTIVFLGDSLTAGLGVGSTQAFPALVEEKIESAHLPFRVVNAGVSGDTSSDGLRRLDWLLQQPINVLVIALGANDGLRGLSPALLETNLQAMIDKTKAKYPEVRIVIAGMQLPPNLGTQYSTEFEHVYSRVAEKNGTALVPFLLDGVGGHPELNQSDQVHPTAAGHKIMADSVWRVLEPILRRS